MNDIKFLSDADKTRYMMYDRLFSTTGWAAVVALCTELAAQATNRAAFAKSWDDNRLAIGNGYAYTHIANLQDLTETEYQQKADAAKAEAQAADETAFE